MAVMDNIGAWMIDNPEIPGWTDDAEDPESARVQRFQDGVPAEATFLVATDIDYRGPERRVGFSIWLESRKKFLWAFTSQADADAFASKARRVVKKSTLIRRAHDAGVLSFIMTALDNPVNAYAKARWWSPDWPEVYFDDPDMVALLTAAGADVAAITAPE